MYHWKYLFPPLSTEYIIARVLSLYGFNRLMPYGIKRPQYPALVCGGGGLNHINLLYKRPKAFKKIHSLHTYT
jgi:hypothetical protein